MVRAALRVGGRGEEEGGEDGERGEQLHAISNDAF
jgi:hypothetical protein